VFCQPRGLDDSIDLLGAESVGSSELRLFAENSKDFRFRNGEAYIIPDAEEYRSRAASLLNDQRTALVLDSTKQSAKIGARVKRANDDAVRHKLSSSIKQTVQLRRRPVTATKQRQ
jgi:hypothetical protein